MTESHIDATKREKAASGSKDTSMTGAPVTIFRHLVNSDLPPSELSNERLSKEAQVLLGAGTVSTARTLDFITYYIVANPDIRKRLTNEISEVMEGYPASKPTWAQLDKLPYLQAVIKEGLRYATSIVLPEDSEEELTDREIQPELRCHAPATPCLPQSGPRVQGMGDPSGRAC
jgi:cytochrome P450